MSQFTETLYDAWGQSFAIDRVYFEHKTDHQHLVIFHNALFGRVMALDGIVQTTERDEFVYHEMLAHVPLLSFAAVHGRPAKRVLIVGGGDGGMLREVLSHASVEQAVQVEIDQAVIDMAIEYLPNHSAGAYDDPRANIVIADGIDYVASQAEAGAQFDVIISDSTDPIGPGEVLFTENFYHYCAKLLGDDGLLVTQNGVAYMQLDEVTTTARRLQPYFADTSFYTAAVPTYVGGQMTFAWATQNAALRNPDTQALQAAFEAASLKTRYYTPAVHQASFALPAYIGDALSAAAGG